MHFFLVLWLKKFIYLFIYLLILAVLGLRFCARAFSSCGERGPLLITVRVPLTVAASLVAEHRLQTRRLSSCGSRAQPLRGMWDLPRPGLEPVSPAPAGRFSTTVPPGKPLIKNFWLKHSSKIAHGSVYLSDYLSTLPKEIFSWPPQYRTLITEFNLKNILEEYWTGSNSISSLLSYLATIPIPRESRNSWNQCGIVVKHIGSIVRWTQVQTVFTIF